MQSHEVFAITALMSLGIGAYIVFRVPQLLVRSLMWLANNTLYRVRVGPEAQRANADKLRDSLRAKFGLNGNVVTQP